MDSTAELSDHTPYRDHSGEEADLTLLSRRPVTQTGAWLETMRNGRVQRYSISGEKFVIGRASHCNLILLSEDRFVSREHAMILTNGEEGLFRISDLSINGTWLNGARLTRRKPEELHSGDVITIEDWELTFHMP
jgi:predicted component of type VI protein secretion system